MTEFLNTYIITPDFFTQFFATIVGIGASVITTIITLRIQNKRERKAQKQLQDTNIQAATELFRAYIACLLAFCKSDYSNKECYFLLTQCKKMENIEQALAKLNANNYPPPFLNTLISLQVKTMLLRTSLESNLKESCDSGVSPNLDTNDIQNLIKQLNAFINSHTQKPEN